MRNSHRGKTGRWDGKVYDTKKQTESNKKRATNRGQESITELLEGCHSCLYVSGRQGWAIHLDHQRLHVRRIDPHLSSGMQAIGGQKSSRYA